MLFAEVVRAAGAVAGTRSRRDKVTRLAACLARMDADEVAIGAGYLAGVAPQGRLGVGTR